MKSLYNIYSREFLPDYQFSSVQSLTCVRLFVTPWTAACQASLSITNSRSLLKLMSFESVMPSNHLILCCPFSFCLQSFPASGSFPMRQLLASGGQSIGTSASASVPPMNIQDWVPLRLTGLIRSVSQSKGIPCPKLLFPSLVFTDIISTKSLTLLSPITVSAS